MGRFISSLLMIFVCYFSIQGALIEKYNSGVLRIEEDSGFGKQMNWDEHFYKGISGMVVSRDGSIFVSSSHKHCIYKFDSSGKLLETFGRKGKGPGDLYHPGKLSILDGKYLVVNEYALSLRMSLFHLSGKFYKVINLKHSSWDCVGLKNNKIAYINRSFDPDRKKTNRINTYKIRILDIKTRKEKLLETLKIPDLSRVKNLRLHLTGTNGSVSLFKTVDNNVIIANTSINTLRIYNPIGKKIKDISLNLPDVPVSSDYIATYKIKIVKDFKDSKNPHVRKLAKKMGKANIKSVFGKILPYYTGVNTDPQGNILVRKKNKDLNDKRILIQVYDTNGHYVTEFKLNQVGNKLISLNTMVITEKSIIGITKVEDEDSYQRIIHSTIK